MGSTPCCDRRTLDFGGVPPRTSVASEGSGPRGPASGGTAAARGSQDLAGVSRSPSGKDRPVDLKVEPSGSAWIVFLPRKAALPCQPSRSLAGKPGSPPPHFGFAGGQVGSWCRLPPASTSPAGLRRQWDGWGC